MNRSMNLAPALQAALALLRSLACTPHPDWLAGRWHESAGELVSIDRDAERVAGGVWWGDFPAGVSTGGGMAFPAWRQQRAQPRMQPSGLAAYAAKELISSPAN